MGQSQSAFKKMTDALDRARARAAGVQAKATEVTREVIGTIEVAVGSFGAGYVNERYGAADKETGIRIHRTNGVPTTGLVGLGGKLVLGATEVAGEYTRDLYRLADGAIGETCGTWGRVAGAKQRLKAEKGSTRKQGASDGSAAKKDQTATNGAEQAQAKAV